LTEISERREVRVRGDGVTFVFVAEPDAGRLVIHEERGDTSNEVCALTIGDRDELRGFLDGMRRAIGVDDGPRVLDRRDEHTDRPAAGPRRSPALAPGAPPAGPPPPGPPGGEEDRQAAIARARQRHGNAFAAWSRDEEQQLLREVDAGRDLDELAREHGRSRRALELRLDKLRG
jgi:hypothetical protein